MPRNHNSASRLHTVFSSIGTHLNSTLALNAWAEILRISDQNQHRLARKVADRLATLAREIDAVRTCMKATNYSEELYARQLQAFEEATSPLHLSHLWGNISRHFTPENLLALQYISEILPDEEVQISVEELAEITTLVSQLRGALTDSKLPLSLITLIKHHIELIEHALAEYPIAGAKALRKASHLALGELIEAKDVVAEHRDTNQISRLGELWKKVNAVVDAAQKIDKLTQVVQKAWKYVEGLLQNS